MPVDISNHVKQRTSSSADEDQDYKGTGGFGGLFLEASAEGASCPASVGAGGSSAALYQEATRPSRNLTSTTPVSRAGSSLEPQSRLRSGESNSVEAEQHAGLQALMASTHGMAKTGSQQAHSSAVRAGGVGPEAHHAIEQNAFQARTISVNASPGTATSVAPIARSAGSSPGPEMSADDKGAVTFAMLNCPSLGEQRQGTSASMDSGHQSVAGSGKSGNHAAHATSGCGAMGFLHTRSSKGQLGPAQLPELSSKETLNAASPELVESSGDTRFEEHWDGLARERAGSQGDRGKLLVGQSAPLSAQDKASANTPLVVGDGRSSSPGWHSMGNKLAKPVTRVRSCRPHNLCMPECSWSWHSMQS